MSEKCPKCRGDMEEMELSAKDAVTAKAVPGIYFVCHNCRFAAMKCEIWSRVVGYLRPTNTWNAGKQSEFDVRKEYKPFKEDKDEK